MARPEVVYQGNGSYRNLYLLAHGNSHKVGGDFDAVPPNIGVAWGVGSAASLSAYQVRTNLGADPNAPLAGRRTYRFVFLDGCKTASGDFPSAFGISPRHKTDLNYYQDSQGNYLQRPCALVGWNIAVPLGGRPR